MRNAIVTGGSRGLGLGIARRLIAAGYRAIVVARKESDELAAAQEELAFSDPGSLAFVPFDLAKIENIAEMVRTVRRDHGPIYALVNNAGMSIEGLLALTPTDQIERIVRLNTVSPIVLTKYVARGMMADGGGRVVNMSSITASTGYKGLSVYAATKASLVGFTRSLARELGPAGITVNAIAPGFVDTAMTESLTPQQRQTIQRRSALGRLVDVEDVASVVEFLLSEGAKNITGTVVTVDAGNTA